MGHGVRTDMPARFCEPTDLIPGHGCRAVVLFRHRPRVDEQVAGEAMGSQHLLAFKHGAHGVIEIEHDRSCRKGGTLVAPGIELVVVDGIKTQFGSDAHQRGEVLACKGKLTFIADAMAHGDRDTEGHGQLSLWHQMETVLGAGAHRFSSGLMAAPPEKPMAQMFLYVLCDDR